MKKKNGENMEKKQFILLFLYASKKREEIPLERMETLWVNVTIHTKLQGGFLGGFFWVCVWLRLIVLPM